MLDKAEDRSTWAKLLRPIIAAIAVGVCTACGLAAWQRSAPLTAPTLFPFSETWYARARASTTAIEGIRDAQMATKLAPENASNWMLLAYQYTRADHVTSPRALAAIRQSYTASPLDMEASSYRLSFIFNAWPYLPQDIRDLAVNEAQEYGLTSKGQQFLTATVPTIPDDRVRLQFAVISLIARQKRDAVNSTFQDH